MDASRGRPDETAAESRMRHRGTANAAPDKKYREDRRDKNETKTTAGKRSKEQSKCEHEFCRKKGGRIHVDLNNDAGVMDRDGLTGEMMRDAAAACISGLIGASVLFLMAGALGRAAWIDIARLVVRLLG